MQKTIATRYITVRLPVTPGLAHAAIQSKRNESESVPVAAKDLLAEQAKVVVGYRNAKNVNN